MLRACPQGHSGQRAGSQQQLSLRATNLLAASEPFGLGLLLMNLVPSSLAVKKEGRDSPLQGLKQCFVMSGFAVAISQ